MKDFPGLLTNMDPDDLTPGAARIQVNATCERAAMLEVRPGYLKVRFEDEG